MSLFNIWLSFPLFFQFRLMRNSRNTWAWVEISPTNFLGKMPARILVPSTEKSWEKLNLGGNQLYKFSSKKKKKRKFMATQSSIYSFMATQSSIYSPGFCPVQHRTRTDLLRVRVLSWDMKIVLAKWYLSSVAVIWYVHENQYMILLDV